MNSTQNIDDPITIVFVGASNTEEGYRANVSYVTRLKSFGDPWQNANLINEGHAGWGMFSYFEQPEMIVEHVIKYEPNYVFIYLGGNDVVTGRGNKLNQSYRYFLDTLNQLDTNNSIIQTFMINFNWGLWLLTASNTDLESYNLYRSLYQNISKDYGLLLLDFNDVFINRTEYFIEGDGHINDLGQQVIAEQIHLATANIISPPVSASSTTASPTSTSTTSIAQIEQTNSTNISQIDTDTKASSFPSVFIFIPVIWFIFRFLKRNSRDKISSQKN